MSDTARRDPQRGALFLMGLFALATLLTLSAAGLTRSMTELSVAQRYAVGLQALHAAEAGIDEAILQLLASPNFTGTTLDLPEGTCAIVVAQPPQTVLNPFSSRGTGANQHVGFAEEQRFTVTATGASGTAQKTLRAIIARAEQPWAGAASTGPIYIESHEEQWARHDAEGAGGYVDPTDVTVITGDLRTNFGLVDSVNNNPGIRSRPVQVPAGATVNGGISIGPVGTPDSAWMEYGRISTPLGTNPLNDDGVWIGNTTTVTFNGTPYTLSAGSVQNPISVTPVTQLVQINPDNLTAPVSCPGDPGYTGDPLDLDEDGLTSSDQDFNYLEPGTNAKVLPGGTFCFRSYHVGVNDTLYYDSPTTVYLNGTPGSSPQLIMDERSNVGVPVNLSSPPTNPQPADFSQGQVSIRTANSRPIDLQCLSHVHGSIVAPNARIILHHAVGYNDPTRGLAFGSFLGQEIELRGGANVSFEPDGGPAGPWVTLKFWEEL